MSGRAARKKKLVRTRRLSDSDSSDTGTGADGGVGDGGPGGRGRAMGETPRWQRTAVRAVELQAGGGPARPGHNPAGLEDTHVKISEGWAELDASFQESRSGRGVTSNKPGGFPYPGFLGNGTRVSVGVCEGEGGGEGGAPHSEGEGSPPPPPPPAWSDPPESQGHHETDTESLPSSSHSSVLVDMGKVVGVLRTYPSQHHRALEAAGNGTGEEGSDYSVTEEEDNVTGACDRHLAAVCHTCAQEARAEGSEREDSLCGDPLVYATFVAPVQQYSTETEPSRQPSFKQNSSEAEPSYPTSATQPEVQHNTCFYLAKNLGNPPRHSSSSFSSSSSTHIKITFPCPPRAGQFIHICPHSFIMYWLRIRREGLSFYLYSVHFSGAAPRDPGQRSCLAAVLQL